MLMGKPVERRVMPLKLQPCVRRLGKRRGRPVERPCPRIADDKIVCHIECEKRPAEPVIGEIHQVAKAGRVVHGLGKCIRRQECHIRGLTFHGDLAGVVIRISDVGGNVLKPAKAGAAGWFWFR